MHIAVERVGGNGPLGGLSAQPATPAQRRRSHCSKLRLRGQPLAVAQALGRVADEVGVERADRLLHHRPHALAELAHHLHQLQPRQAGGVTAPKYRRSSSSSPAASSPQFTLRLPRSKHRSFMPAYSKSSSHTRSVVVEQHVPGQQVVVARHRGQGSDGKGGLDAPALLMQQPVRARRHHAVRRRVAGMPLDHAVDGEGALQRAAVVERAQQADHVGEAAGERRGLEVPAGHERGDERADARAARPAPPGRCPVRRRASRPRPRWRGRCPTARCVRPGTRTTACAAVDGGRRSWCW